MNQNLASCTSDKLCLLFNRESNKARISEVLSARYTVETKETVEAAIDATPNLYILDEGFLVEHKENIAKIKQESQSAYQPLLLLTTHDEQRIKGNIWRLIDDVVTIPTQPTLLANRVENLVARQKLSQKVANQRDQATTLFQKVFESSNDAICIADLEREEVRTSNQAAKDLFGYSDGAIEGVHLSDLYPQYKEFSQFVQQVRDEGRGRTEDLVGKKSTGETFPVALSSALVEIDGRLHIITNLRDISGQKKLEEERIKSEHYRKRLYELTSNSELTFDEKIEHVLELGRDRLDVENGHLVRINVDEGSHMILSASGSEVIQTGDSNNLASTYCRKTINTESVLTLHNAPEQGWEDDPAFQTHGLSSYASSRLSVDGKIFGTVCFVDKSPRENPFNEREKSFIELIARWLSHELERQAHTEILRNLHKTTVEQLKSETEEEIIEIAVEAAEHLFEIKIAAVYLFQDRDSMLKLATASDRAKEVLDLEIPLEWSDENTISRAFRERESIWIPNIQSAEGTREYESIQSLHCLPLGDHGVFVIGSPDLNAFSHSQREELELLGTNTASALTRSDREKRLREAHERRLKLFKNSTDCIVEVAFDDRIPLITDVNPAFESVFGYAISEVQGKSLKNLIVPPGLETEADENINRGLRGESFQCEVRRDTANGRRDFLFRSVPIEDDGEFVRGYFVYTDITERRRQEQQVQVLNRILRHNLRNKANIIHGHATIVQEQVEGEVADAVAVITEAANDLVNLTRKVAQFRKTSQHGGTSDDVNLVSLIEEVAAEIRDDFDDASVIIEGPERAEVVGGGLLKIAFYEIIENAIKHTESSTPKVFVNVNESHLSDRWIEITVTDNGPGIPEVEKEVLEAGIETSLRHGSGLGLWVVNWIVKSLGGDFTIETSDQKGARVRFKLPKQTVEVPDDNGSLSDELEW